MRFQSIGLIALSAALAACSTIPMEVSNPAPVQVVLRVTETASCPAGAACSGTPEPIRRHGPLLFVDGDSVVMTDMKGGRRTTIRPGPGIVLEVYRGQHRTAAAVAKGAGKGLLAGVIVGAAEGLVSGGLSELVGLDGAVGPAVKTGIVGGGSAGFLAGAATGYAEGDAVWEPVTLLQLRQLLCHCAEPDGKPPVRYPAGGPIP